MKMKKKSGAAKAKKSAPKKKTAAKSATSGKASTKPTVRVAEEKPRSSSSYTPQAVQGIGWAPFRYPPQ